MCEKCLCKKAYEEIDMYYLMSINEAKGTLQIFKNRGNGSFGMLFTEIPIEYCPMCRKEAYMNIDNNNTVNNIIRYTVVFYEEPSKKRYLGKQ